MCEDNAKGYGRKFDMVEMNLVFEASKAIQGEDNMVLMAQEKIGEKSRSRVGNFSGERK